MDWPQIIGSIAVLLVAFIAYVRASAALRTAEAARLDASRRASSVETDLRQEVDTLKRLMAKLSAGEHLTPEMIEDGQLWRDVDGPQAAELVAKHPNLAIVDVRTSSETASGVIAGAKVIPMDELDERRGEIPGDGRPILVYCAAGARSAAVCEALARSGTDNLYNLNGGFGAWPGETSPPS